LNEHFLLAGMRLYPYILFLFLIIAFSSCIVHAPKFTTIEKVLALKLGTNQEEVSAALGIPPYNIILKTDTETVLLYKYRVTDRTTLPFLLKESNGHKKRGRYVNLKVFFDRNGKSKKLESCHDCDETIVEEKRLDVNKVMNILTVTLPVILVFLGIKLTN
jgi:hypothetical protein